MPATITGTVSWWLILVLIVAPHLGALLQLALSRTRELDADLDAAGLTGDPLGLAAALAKLEQQHARLWESLMLPGRRLPEPSLLRTHPPTEERIRRLLALAGAELAPPEPRPELILLPDHLRPRHAAPRWRMSGLWY